MELADKLFPFNNDRKTLIEKIKAIYTAIINGGYDITKYYFKKLWWDITKGKESNIPFTISIEGIPTINGTETIKRKSQGQMSDEDRDKVLEKTCRFSFFRNGHLDGDYAPHTLVIDTKVFGLHFAKTVAPHKCLQKKFCVLAP